MLTAWRRMTTQAETIRADLRAKFPDEFKPVATPMASPARRSLTAMFVDTRTASANGRKIAAVLGGSGSMWVMSTKSTGHDFSLAGPGPRTRRGRQGRRDVHPVVSANSLYCRWHVAWLPLRTYRAHRPWQDRLRDHAVPSDATGAAKSSVARSARAASHISAWRTPRTSK